jgi:hypothetical protein
MVGFGRIRHGTSQGGLVERKIEDVADTLRQGQKAGRGCTLLIGAGCSVTAGIPTAQGFVDLIRENHRAAYDRAEPKTYMACMNQLTSGVRRDMIAEKVDRARINWAHMAIAQLMREGYVDRVLTTNFDRLVVRASAALGQFPAVYDFGASQLFKPADVPEKAVFHLHGQRTGFVLIITDQQTREHFDRLKPVFDDAGSGRTWIVVGYSGESDPVFDHLANVKSFDFGLYWVGYGDTDPTPAVRERLLEAEKDAYFIRGYDADRFFVDLTRKLECFPPDLVRRPFTHLKTFLETLTEFRLTSGEQTVDVLEETRHMVSKAIGHFEQSHEPTEEAGAPAEAAEPPKPPEPATAATPSEPDDALQLQATTALMAGNYEEVQTLARKLGDKLQGSLTDIVAWSFVAHGDQLAEQAKTKDGDEADRLFTEAGEKYRQALSIKPDKHEALYNWGNALLEQAKT